MRISARRLTFAARISTTRACGREVVFVSWVYGRDRT